MGSSFLVDRSEKGTEMGIAGVSAYSNTGVYNNKAKSTETELTEAIKNFEELHKLSAKELK